MRAAQSRQGGAGAELGHCLEGALVRLLQYVDDLPARLEQVRQHKPTAGDAEEEEHRLEWTKIFEDYLKLFEDVLAGFIDKKGGNYAQFYRECREKQEGGSPEEKHFLKLLLASADYQDFSRIMVREARYYYSTGISHFGYVPPEAVEMDDKYQDPRFAKGK